MKKRKDFTIHIDEERLKLIRASNQALKKKKNVVLDSKLMGRRQLTVDECFDIMNTSNLI